MLTEHDLALVRTETERQWNRYRLELVAEIAAYVECWGGVDPRRGKLRKCMARDIMSRFGTQEDGE